MAFKGLSQSKLFYESVNPHAHKNMCKIMQENTKYLYIIYHKGIIFKTSPVCFVDGIFTWENNYFMKPLQVQTLTI